MTNMTEMDFNSLSEREWALCDQRGDFFSRRFGLPVSLVITRTFIKFGLSENHASLLMLLTGLAGASLMVFGSWGVLLGSLLLLLHHIMDYVDGQIARHHSRASIRGAVLDRWNHFVVETATFPCLALGLYFQSGQIWILLVVWCLYGWNRFRIMLAQLGTNILADELSSYPLIERQMMRANMTMAPELSTASRESGEAPATARADGKLKYLRRKFSHARVASTSFNGFTMLLATAALADLLASYFLHATGVLEALVSLIAIYFAINFFDYSWTYLRTNRIEKDLFSRL